MAQLLDGLSHDDRVAAVRTLGKLEQRSLWEAVDGFRPVTLADIVPRTVESNREVRHFGKNSLALFTHFEKRFLPPEGQDAERRRRSCTATTFSGRSLGTWFSGPGYFVAVGFTRSARGADGLSAPSGDRIPRAGRTSAPIEKGGARLVYGFMVDTLRRVSEHVTIGRANRHGKDMNAWFLLCRDGRLITDRESRTPSVFSVATRDLEIVRRRAASSLRAKPANSPPAPLDPSVATAPSAPRCSTADLAFQASEASVGQESGRSRGGDPTALPAGRGGTPLLDRLNARSFESAEGDRES